jgi:hypothetical protein
MQILPDNGMHPTRKSAALIREGEPTILLPKFEI